jgi:hypothetical protein
MKVRRHARNILCKVDSHRRIKNARRWRFFACGRWWTSRKALLDALLPGLNALFGLEYAKYDHKHEFERSLLETN